MNYDIVGKAETGLEIVSSALTTGDAHIVAQAFRRAYCYDMFWVVEADR